MKKLVTLLTLCMSMAAMAIGADVASAHTATVTASVDCSGLVSYTATAWTGGTTGGRTNPDVGITVNGAAATGGAFTSPSFSFSGTKQIAVNTPAVVVVTANGTWGDGVAGGQTDTATAPAATNCVPPVPVCVAPQVLQNNVCVTPAPVCTAPQVLQNNVCVTPPPVCVAPQVLQNGACVTPPPVCTAPKVLQNGTCVTPPTTDTVTEIPIAPETPVTVDTPRTPVTSDVPDTAVTIPAATREPIRGELPYTGNSHVGLIAVIAIILILGGLYLHRRGR